MSSSDEEFKKFLTQYVINWGIETGSSWEFAEEGWESEFEEEKEIKRNPDKSTIENLISAFYGEEDPIKGVLILQLYIARQKGRKEIPPRFASNALSYIAEIYNKYKDDKEKLREAIETFLLALKWSYESKVKSVRNMDDFIIKAVSNVYKRSR
jgi:hypothetical protein